MRWFFLMICGLLLPFNSITAQPNYFTKIFGEDHQIDRGIAVVQLQSGSIYYAGYSEPSHLGNADIILIKLDASGNLLWQQAYGTSDSDICYAMEYDATTQQLIIAGTAFNDQLGRGDGLLIGIDTLGNEQFLERYGTSNLNEAFHNLSISQTGAYLTCGIRTGRVGIGNDFYLCKTNTDGQLIWEKMYGSSFNDVAMAVQEDTDGSIVVSGDKQDSTNRYHAFILKTDNLGNKLWDKEIMGNYNGGCKNLMITSDGTYVIVGEASTLASSAFDVFVVKLDRLGTLYWKRWLPATNASDAGFDIIEANAQQYIITGYGYNPLSQSADVHLIQIDSAANVEAIRYFGGVSLDIAYTVVPSVYGGYLIAGISGQGDDQFFLIYNGFETLSTINLNKVSDFYCYPSIINRTTSLHFSSPIEDSKLILYDKSGRIVYSSLINYPTKNYILNTQLKDDYYYLRLIVKGNQYTQIILWHKNL